MELAKLPLLLASLMAMTELPAVGSTQLSSETLRDTMLGTHAAARRAVGVGPLAWNPSLAARAQAYADELARTGRFRHSGGLLQEAQGENLWMGTRGAYRFDEMAGAWVEESRNFVNAPTPAFSRTGQWQDVGHYAQIVWRGTREVGCGMASDDEEDYLVCRYSPAGNVIGRAAF
nr:CAP domain-containing protein [Sphingomonas sp. Leaf339]